tara:strand:- start:301 stop:948 length:648 start_codon:yes stop_codon:yes gene_type:complete
LEKKFKKLKGNNRMKKNTLLLLFTLLFSFCSPTDTETTETESQTNNLIIFTKGLGKSTSEYVTNWNKLISEIANDEDTVLYFSINPDKAKWASAEQTVLFYQFGQIEETSVSFALNLIVEDDRVTSVEFFSPVVSDETASQRTKLFFLILVAMADDTLDKDGRESVLSKLGLYDEVTTPDQLGGSLTLNKVQYIIEPLVDKGLLVGLNFYISQLD